jgi:hypothetical protein
MVSFPRDLPMPEANERKEMTIVERRAYALRSDPARNQF